MLLIVCGDIEANAGPCSDMRDLRPIFMVFMPIRMSWLWLDRIMFWFVMSLKSLIAAISLKGLEALVAPAEAEELHTWCPG